MNWVFFAVSLCASVVGAICGIGGGVIIKPILDLLGVSNVATASFLAGCTVLSMSCYSVGRTLFFEKNRMDLKIGTSIAIGAVFGGIIGRQLFAYFRAAARPDAVGAAQAIGLAIMTALSLLYTVLKRRIKPHRVQRTELVFLIGVALGAVSAFLGIGGGPFHLVVLTFFFGMDAKAACISYCSARRQVL